jgi:RND family efflux transporter MFP subunit
MMTLLTSIFYLIPKKAYFESKNNILFFLVFKFFLLACFSFYLQANDKHEVLPLSEKHSETEGSHSSELIHLKPNSENIFRIKTKIMQLQSVSKVITAPSEVVLNAYKTAIVALRINGEVIKRFAKMGDQVKKGQVLAEISSIQMADAQQAYIVDSKEWMRVKILGKSLVSGQRYFEVRSNWQLSKARLLALGFVQHQLKRLEKKGIPDGRFKLFSPIDGIIFKDDFIQGQYIQAGGRLFVISDESSIWVEVSLSPLQASLFGIGDLADVFHHGESHAGKIIQVSQVISEKTRPQKIRIEVNNHNDDLHPGQFVSTRLKQKASEKKILVPDSALIRTSDGDWAVFIEVKPKQFKQHEITLIRREGDLMVISGVNVGEKVVIEGAFYLSAELAKSGFDPHGH